MAKGSIRNFFGKIFGKDSSGGVVKRSYPVKKVKHELDYDFSDEFQVIKVDVVMADSVQSTEFFGKFDISHNKSGVHIVVKKVTPEEAKQFEVYY